MSGAADHIWCIFDRASGQRHLRQARDITGESLPAALSAMRHREIEESCEYSLSETAEATKLLAGLLWGDLDGDLRAMEQALRLALEATAEDLARWERCLGGDEWDDDEFSVPPEAVEVMTPERRLAYVARLVATVALRYGVGAESGGSPLVGEEVPGSLAALLRGLNDIFAWGVERSIGDGGPSES